MKLSIVLGVMSICVLVFAFSLLEAEVARSSIRGHENLRLFFLDIGKEADATKEEAKIYRRKRKMIALYILAFLAALIILAGILFIITQVEHVF
jgi:hypothetical protein